MSSIGFEARRDALGVAVGIAGAGIMGIMGDPHRPAPYDWTSRQTPPGFAHVGILMDLLGLSEWAARRRLVASGFGKLVTRRWRYHGRWFTRKFWIMPEEAVIIIALAPLQRDATRALRRLRGMRRKAAAGGAIRGRRSGG